MGFFSNPDKAYGLVANAFTIMAEEWMKRFEAKFAFDKDMMDEFLISFLQHDRTINFLIGFADLINENNGVKRNSEKYFGIFASSLKEAFQPYIDSDILIKNVNFRIEEEFDTKEMKMMEVRDSGRFMANMYTMNPEKYITYMDAQGIERPDKAMWWNNNKIFEKWLQDSGY